MKYKIFLLSLVSVLFFSFGCKDDDLPFSDCFKEPDGDKRLNLKILSGPTVTLPSKVSIFFKVTDNTGNPVGYLSEDDFEIFEQGLNDACHRKISSESKRKISPDEQFFSHTTLLVLDLSGSVLQNNLEPLQAAATEFIDAIMPETPDNSTAMGIWWFDGEDILHPLVPVTYNKSTLKLGILAIDQSISVDNSTDLYGAVIKSAAEAQTILDQQVDSIISAVSVVIFTDGRDVANRYLKGDAVTAVYSSPADISFFTIGIGGDIEDDILRELGRNGSDSSTDIGELAMVFNNVASFVSAEANSYYLFEYCSPIRNGSSNGLIIEANASGGLFGDLQTTFDATGFTGGCDL